MSTYLHGERGLTLIELLVTLSIATILMTIGVPSFSAFINEARLDAAETSLASAVQFAQSEALKRNAEIRLVPNNADNDWNQGFQVQVGDEVLRELEGPVGNAFSCSDSCTALTFSGAGTTTARTFYVCSNQGVGRQLALYATGKVKASDWDGCGDDS